MQSVTDFIQRHLIKVRKPSQYIAHEMNIVKKDWKEVKAKICLVYPDRYEIGMSNLALQIFYDLINRKSAHVLERCFLPDSDMEEMLKERKVPLFSLESSKALSEFDALAFSFSTELSFTNALLALDLAFIPLLAKDRLAAEEMPIVYAGGGGVSNPLPMSIFFDFIVIGDGEDAFVEIADMIYELKYVKKFSKLQILEEINKKPWAYVPDLGKKVVKRNVYTGFLEEKLLTEPLVPLIDVVHGRFSLEIMKGCPRVCRFCQASYINKPLRIRDKDKLIEQGMKVIEKTGYQELSLSSLSSGDHPQIISLLKELNQECYERQVSLSLPSLRVDSFTDELSFMMNKVRQTGVTIAPEAGSQFLRDVIKKQITEEDILRTAKFASLNSNKSIKMYFMIGLPRETTKDLEELVALVYKIMDYIKPKKNKLIINISNFVPKPFTPFQWCAQDSVEVLEEKLSFFKSNLRHRQMELRWTDTNLSKLESILSRGDEKVAGLVLRAYQNGASFDSWYDRFKYDIWDKSAEELGLDVDKYLKGYDLSEELPWSFIDMVVTKDYLEKEYKSAYAVDNPAVTPISS
ncbi:MAG: radical SAM protein [Candidatus Margulisbacteria bacterium]|nr:radical SAM protein [Candidatus Margulisiibacteriota bacterium]